MLHSRRLVAQNNCTILTMLTKVIEAVHQLAAACKKHEA